MFYETKKNNHGLKYNPFKSCIVPRPIAWITSVDSKKVINCAPYSFFNGVASDPPMIMFANNGKKIANNVSSPKDTFSNITKNKDFVVNMVTYESKKLMNETSIDIDSGLSEIDYTGLEVVDSILINCPRIKISPIQMECRLLKTIELPCNNKDEYNGIIIGNVLGIHIDDNFIKEDKIDLKSIKLLSRLGYYDYSIVDKIFEMKRPKRLFKKEKA